MRKLSVNSNYDRARDLNEQAMESVHSKVEQAKDRIEKLVVELSNVNLSVDEWQMLDDLAVKALTILDKIAD